MKEKKKINFQLDLIRTDEQINKKKARRRHLWMEGEKSRIWTHWYKYAGETAHQVGEKAGLRLSRVLGRRET